MFPPPPPEAFLHYLWQFQQFSGADLRAESGEAVQVLHPGWLNSHAGADFQEARLLLDDVEWVGTVEIHRRSSDWFQHNHQADGAYENVVLHVVWQHDAPVTRRDGTHIPTLALAPRTDLALLARYQALLDAREPIPCAAQFERVGELPKLSMLDRALMQRLQTKAEAVVGLFLKTGNDWEETAWRVVARAFGFKLNAEPMERLAGALPPKILQKHRGNPLQLEALLFGTAGLLSDPAEADEHAARLGQEFGFLEKKYGLADRRLSTHEWKFLRLRPAGFPTVRLAQLAALVNRHPHFFALLTQTDSAQALRAALDAPQSDYWQRHYVWGKPAAHSVPGLGEEALNSLIINAAVPLLAAYARERGQSDFLEKAIRLLEELPAEKNSVIAEWRALGLRVKTAFDSQGALEWHARFCTPRQCFRCNVGAALLKGEGQGAGSKG